MEEELSNKCYSCIGVGTRKKRVRIGNGKWGRIEVTCNTCNGKGSILRSKRRNADGTWKKKLMRKSYPAFVAPGPLPVGDCGDSNLLEREDEELCFLVGSWKIFQRLDKHRYSTDDLITSWTAVREAKLLGYASGSPLVLDIGCGIGSVLLSTAWQLPNAKCAGIEVQPDRYAQACRSIKYNLGTYPDDQQQVYALLGDLRTNEFPPYFQHGFDIVTGTPPYFGDIQGAKPACHESTGCLFELKGGVEDYCESAKRFLRRPGACTRGNENEVSKARADVDVYAVDDAVDDVKESSADRTMDDSSLKEVPSVFVLCNTSLASSRVYIGCHQNELSVIKRIDVIPREGKSALLSVFVIVLTEWLIKYPHFFPAIHIDLSAPPLFIDQLAASRDGVRVTGSLLGELCEEIIVRNFDLSHTKIYQDILADLGKPSSVDREVYDVSSVVTAEDIHQVNSTIS
jgi:tRNA1(Val) A37 N6-methylase TrmN6